VKVGLLMACVPGLPWAALALGVALVATAAMNGQARKVVPSWAAAPSVPIATTRNSALHGTDIAGHTRKRAWLWPPGRRPAPTAVGAVPERRHGRS
jgi:hypothetical protein